MSEFEGNTNQDRLKKRFSKPEGEISRRELLKMALPFGKVELDSTQCTGCSLCAFDCPTEAIAAVTGEAGDYQLVFWPARCVACGRCVVACPEQCLRLERVLDLDKLYSRPAVLFEGEIVRCQECGEVVGSRAMIDRLRGRLLASGNLPTAQLELCPACKVRAQCGQG